MLTWQISNWIAPLDPKTVWETYLDGNGSSRILNMLTAYGVDISILKTNKSNRAFQSFKKYDELIVNYTIVWL